MKLSHTVKQAVKDDEELNDDLYENNFLVVGPKLSLQNLGKAWDSFFLKNVKQKQKVLNSDCIEY